MYCIIVSIGKGLIVRCKTARADICFRKTLPELIKLSFLLKHKQQHLTQHTAEPVCHGSDQIEIPEFAKELLQPVRDFMLEHNLNTIYLVTPSPMLTKKETNLVETMSDTVTEIFKDAFSDMSVYTREDLKNFAAQHTGFNEMLIDDTYRTSLTEQEICFKSEWFLGDVVSSWSQTVLADRRARQIERDNELEDLLTLPNALVGKMVPIGETEHLEPPPEPPGGYAAIPGSDQHPNLPGFGYSNDNSANPAAPAAAPVSSNNLLPAPEVFAAQAQAFINQAAGVDPQDPDLPQVPQHVPDEQDLATPMASNQLPVANQNNLLPSIANNTADSPSSYHSLPEAQNSVTFGVNSAPLPSNNLLPEQPAAPVINPALPAAETAPLATLAAALPAAPASVVPAQPLAPVAAAAPNPAMAPVAHESQPLVQELPSNNLQPQPMQLQPVVPAASEVPAAFAVQSIQPEAAPVPLQPQVPVAPPPAAAPVAPIAPVAVAGAVQPASVYPAAQPEIPPAPPANPVQILAGNPLPNPVAPIASLG